MGDPYKGLDGQKYSVQQAANKLAYLMSEGGGVFVPISWIDQPDGVAGLDGAGLLSTAVLPPLSITDTFVVASQAAMLALTAERGDVAIRTDLDDAAYILKIEPASTLANWIPISVSPKNFTGLVDTPGAYTGAANKIVVVNGTPDGLVFETRETAFNKTFGISAGNVPDIATALGLSQTVETDGSGKLISAAIATAYNKAFGIAAGSVIEGDKAAILLGRAGGQTLIGGIAASENLILQSTSHGTKGFVQVEDILRIKGDDLYLQIDKDDTTPDDPYLLFRDWNGLGWDDIVSIDKDGSLILNEGYLDTWGGLYIRGSEYIDPSGIIDLSLNNNKTLRWNATQFEFAGGPLDMGTQKITSVVDPTPGSQEVATANYVDSVAPPKAGSVAPGSFAGNPKKATVTFSTAFPDANYAITITGADGRSWTIESKVAGSFVINSGSNTAPTGDTDWIATKHNDP